MATNNEKRIDELLRENHFLTRDEAIELLSFAANYLESRKIMPDALADYLADAFRYTASAPQSDDPSNSGDGKSVEEERISRLIKKLHLKYEKGGQPRKKLPVSPEVYGKIGMTIGLRKNLIPEDKKPWVQAMNKKYGKKQWLLYDSRRAMISETELAKEFSEKYGISVTTALKEIKKIKEQFESGSKILDEIKKSNGIKSWVIRR